LLNDRERRAAIVAAGLERARRFTWGRTASELLQVLENL
jgi:glycosyltransferase involved in cell wall biosynthesis